MFHCFANGPNNSSFMFFNGNMTKPATLCDFANQLFVFEERKKDT